MPHGRLDIDLRACASEEQFEITCPIAGHRMGQIGRVTLCRTQVLSAVLVSVLLHTRSFNTSSMSASAISAPPTVQTAAMG